MKLIRLVLVAAILITTLPGKSFSNEFKLEKQLNKIMTYPSFMDDCNGGAVYCKFRFDNRGRIIIQKIEGTNDIIKSYVLDRLYDIRYCSVSKESFNVRFIFRKE